jgi:hypothetical protein
MAMRDEDRRRSWANYEAALEALRADPEAWVEHQRASSAWDAALRHGRGAVGDQSHTASPARSEA